MDENFTSSNRLLELDALRGIACLFVVLFHFNVNQPDAQSWMNWGVTGVDLFFIISDFVIYYSLNRRSDFKQFVISRFSRLYPAYWAALIITSSVLFLVGKPVGVKDFLANLTMVQGYFGVEDIDGSYWTLGIELFFYGLAIFPFLVHQQVNMERFLWTMLIAIFCWHQWMKPSHPSFYDQISRHLQFVNHAPLFMAGIFFYLIAMDKGTPIRYLGVMSCFVLACFLHFMYGRTQWVISFEAHAWMLFFYFAMFFLMISNELKFLVNRVTLFLGKISYSLYLIHQRINTEVVRPYLKHHLFAHAPNWLYSLLMLSLSIALAYLIMEWVELPFMAYIRNKFLSKKKVLITEK